MFLSTHLKEISIQSKYSEMKSAIKSMIEKFDEYWPKIEEISLVCLLLDPRFKCSFLNKPDKKKV